MLWISLREEPILYVNGRPFVLRNAKDPFRNLEITGISCERVEAMESRLREDAVAEAAATGGYLLLHEEEAGSVVSRWALVDATALSTPREVCRATRGSAAFVVGGQHVFCSLTNTSLSVSLALALG